MIVKDSKDEILQFLVDQSNFKGDCDKVFFVEDGPEISDVLIRANNLKVPVTVSGNHTSLTGSSIPQGGWVIATDGLNRILEINIKGKYAWVEAGVTLRDLQFKLREYNLFFPPDPTEDSCYIGGMIGTNASGARSFKYGSTRNHISAFEIILPDGQLIYIERGEKIIGNNFELTDKIGKSFRFEVPDDYNLPAVKNTVGYYLKSGMDLIDLFIGAEGTLGIISKVKLNLEVLPPDILSLVIFSDNIDQAFRLIQSIKQQHRGSKSIDPRAIEFFDVMSLKLLREAYTEIPESAVCALWIEQESATDITDSLSEWGNFLEKQDVDFNDVWIGNDANDRLKIVNMRHSLPVLVNDIVRKNGFRKIGTDIATPHEKFEQFYHCAIDRVNQSGMAYVAFGHFGDSHLHLNFLPSTNEELILAKEINSYLCLHAISLGGTFSAEHGVGKIKKQYTLAMLGEKNMQFLKRIKSLFDPNHILGVGNII